MRLIDLDQTIYVPILDESQGGCRYELQMTVGEFFDRFLEGSFTPEVVDAIPVEWLDNKFLDIQNKDKALSRAAWLVLHAWQKEQEAR